MTVPRDPRHRAPTTPRRPGYTLIEVLVTVAILTVLAVVIIPVLTGEDTTERAARADTALKAVTDALTAFADDVGEWPSSLDQLVTPLASGHRDICGTQYNGGERNAWAGPYLSRPVAAGGLQAGIGTIAPGFTLAPGTEIDFLYLTVTGVEEGDAVALNARVDGDADPAAGAVRWTAAGGGQVTVTWWVPIPAC
jgi:prepilin-type N-terminal cleavage/methylation domain-containing protein